MSKYIGVRKNSAGGYQAMITIASKQYYLGSSVSEKTCALMYNKAAEYINNNSTDAPRELNCCAQMFLTLHIETKNTDE